MKNIIKYYYGLDVDSVIEKDNSYRLVIDKINYLLCKCNKLELIEYENYLINNYVFHEIILTINKDITVIINGEDYVLLKLKTPYIKICLDDIYKFNYPIDKISNSVNKWINLWSDHVDYIEYQIHEFSYKYPILSKYIYYYIGLAENAIELLKTVDNIDVYEYLGHKRINPSMTLVDLYNPTMLVLDSRVRDISEYFKSSFFDDDIEVGCVLNDIYNVIKQLNHNELKLFLARMLYPTYFFDVYDQIVGYGADESAIYNLVKKSEKYEFILKKIYEAIKKATHIENIEWLIQLH